MPPRTYSIASLLPWILILFAIVLLSTQPVRNWLMSSEDKAERAAHAERTRRINSRPTPSVAELDRRKERRLQRYSENRRAREAEEKAREAAAAAGQVEATEPLLPAEAPPDPAPAPVTAEADPVASAAERRLLRRAITPVHQGQIPRDLLQVLALYDGAPSNVQIEIEMTEGPPLLVIDIVHFQEAINVREFDLAGLQPTGAIEVRGTKANGVVDGVAVGMLWVANNGEYRVLQSHRNKSVKRPLWVCGWPLDLDPNKYRKGLGDRPGDPWDNVEIALCGAQLVRNGSHQLR